MLMLTLLPWGSDIGFGDICLVVTVGVAYGVLAVRSAGDPSIIPPVASTWGVVSGLDILVDPVPVPVTRWRCDSLSDAVGGDTVLARSITVRNGVAGSRACGDSARVPPSSAVPVACHTR